LLKRAQRSPHRPLSLASPQLVDGNIEAGVIAERGTDIGGPRD
jgi:hypothetical protein